MTEGPGERAEKARRQRYSLIFAGFMILGGIIGAILTVTGPDGMGTITPGWAIAVAALLLVTIPGGSWLFLRAIDEVELNANLVASTWALNFYVLLYPVWYILWKGDVVREPQHETLFIATLVVMAVTYFWKKARP